jgi:putative oxidoreductase
MLFTVGFIFERRKDMLKKLFQTENDTATMILRVVLGVVFFPHGMQKLTTMFGGYGFTGTMGWFTGNLHVPALFAFLAIMAEGIGWMGLISGLLTRVAAFGITVNMVVAVYMIHWQNGFFMNWFSAMTSAGKPAGEGFEYHLLVIAIGIALLIRGGGKWSIDKVIAEKFK